jgi:cyclophilin family peptidyl-prolyl cis-trans isomerase
MNQRSKGDVFRFLSYTVLIGAFTIAFIYLLVYGERNAEQLEFTRLKTEASFDQNVYFKTAIGYINIALNSSNAPISTYSFVSLASNGFYDDSVFNKAVVDYYVEGGEKSKVSSKASASNVLKHLGATFAEANPDLELERGDVLLINSGPTKKEYHFLIVTADNLVLLDKLKGRYPLVGKVVSGMDVVEQIEKLRRDKQEVLLEQAKVL